MQTHDNKDTAPAIPDWGGADKAPDRLTEPVPEAPFPEEVSEFRDWSMRCYRLADEVKGLYIEKLRECNRLLRSGKMTPSEYREAISVYEKADAEIVRLMSLVREREFELRGKYGEEFFAKR